MFQLAQQPQPQNYWLRSFFTPAQWRREGAALFPLVLTSHVQPSRMHVVGVQPRGISGDQQGCEQAPPAGPAAAVHEISVSTILQLEVISLCC